MTEIMCDTYPIMYYCNHNYHNHKGDHYHNRTNYYNHNYHITIVLTKAGLTMVSPVFFRCED